MAVTREVIAGQRARLRRGMRAVALASMALLFASCTAQASPAPAAPAGAGHLRITQVRVGDALPIEGALSYIRVERAAGAAIAERQLPESGTLTLTVPPGAYRLVSWLRICDANCGNLDPPGDQCARPFTLGRGEGLHAAIRVTFTGRCVIVLHR